MIYVFSYYFSCFFFYCYYQIFLKLLFVLFASMFINFLCMLFSQFFFYVVFSEPLIYLFHYIHYFQLLNILPDLFLFIFQKHFSINIVSIVENFHSVYDIVFIKWLSIEKDCIFSNMFFPFFYVFPVFVLLIL